MSQIQLTQGQVAIVDDADYARLSAHKWCAMWNPTTRSFYAIRSVKRRGVKSATIYMHREIMGVASGHKPEVDHINAHDTLDNRRSNLRIATTAQNKANCRKYKNNTSGFKGVSMLSPTRWRARIRVNDQLIHLGYFSEPIAAASAYDQAARHYFGEFARGNEVNP